MSTVTLADIAYTARIIQVFWSHVDKTGDCWIWRGPQNGRGWDVDAEAFYWRHKARYQAREVSYA